MSQYVETPTRAFTAGAAIGKHLRVKLTAGVLAAAGSTDVELGTLEDASFASGDIRSVRLRTAQGTRKMVAVAAITAGNPAYAAASGKIDASGTVYVGTALETSSADNDVIEVLPGPNTDISATITGTNAATFQADADLGKPRAALGSQTGGTGDFKAVIRPPATLTADRVFSLNGDAADTLLGIGTAQTLTAVHTFGNGYLETAQTVTPDAVSGAGATIGDGVHDVTVAAVTNDANDWIVLPAIANVPIGHTIRIAANAGGNFEMRTPASSNTKINDVDSDGSQEHLCTDTDLIIVTKRTTTGWVAQSLTKLGAVRTAVIPD